MGTEKVPMRQLTEKERLQVLLREAANEARVAVRKLGEESGANSYWAGRIGSLIVQFSELVPQFLDLLEVEGISSVPDEQLETPPT